MIFNLLSKFSASVRYCSVDTELIDGDNDAWEQFCSRRIRVFVYRCSSTSFALLGRRHLFL